MSRLDYVTIGIVVVCIAALAFLLYRTTNLFGGNDPEVTESDNIYADTTAIDPYAYDDYSDTTAILPSTDEDSDDNEINDYEAEPVNPAPSTTRPTRTQPAPTTTTEPDVAEETTGASGRAGDYLVLAGSYSVRENATRESQRLRKLGYENAEVSPFNRGAYAVVLVDRFENVADARSLVAELKGKGVEAYVKEKQD